MTRVLVREEVAAPAAEVWALLGDFGGVGRLVKDLVKRTSCEGEGVGALRTLELADGGAVRERLDAFDAARRSLTYSIVGESPLPVRDYRATVEVVESGPERCRVEWRSTFEPAGAPEPEVRALVEGIYRDAIEGVRRELGAG